MSGEKRATSEGTLVLEDGIEIPAIFNTYGVKIQKPHVRKLIQDANAKQVLRNIYKLYICMFRKKKVNAFLKVLVPWHGFICGGYICKG